MQELRCPVCNRLLGKAKLLHGSEVEIACKSKRCKAQGKNVVKFKPKDIDFIKSKDAKFITIPNVKQVEFQDTSE